MELKGLDIRIQQLYVQIILCLFVFWSLSAV